MATERPQIDRSDRQMYYSFLGRTLEKLREEMPIDDFKAMMFKWWETKEEPPQVDERRKALLKEILPSLEEIEELYDEEEEEEDQPWTREELMGYSLPDLKQILLEFYILKKNTKEEIVSKILEEQAKEEEDVTG